MKNVSSPLENIAEEKVVLGQVLNSEAAYWQVAETLKAYHFSRQIHQVIYGGIGDILNEGKKLSLTLLQAKIGEEYGDGLSTMTLLTALLRDAENGDMEGVEVIIDLWKRRKHLEELRRALKDAETTDTHIADLMAAHETRFQDIGHSAQSSPARSIHDIVKSALAKSQKAQASGSTPGQDTGLPSLDEIMGRMHGGDLGFIGADPGIGKTILAQQIAQHVAFDMREAVRINQLEMSGEDMARRYLAGESFMSTSQVEEGAYDFDQYEHLKAALAKSVDVPLYIDDEEDLYVEQVIERLVAMKRSRNVKLSIIDHLMKLRARPVFKDRFERTTYVTGRLKAAAKKLDICIVVLVHRTMTTARAGYVPRLQDLDGGGAVQKDADWVIGMARPDLAMQHERPDDFDSKAYRDWAEKLKAAKDTTELYLLKGRRSAWGTMRTFDFNGKLSRITEIQKNREDI